MFGCYLYNFGESKQATGKSVVWQLDWYREKILYGEAEGVVLHTNTMADLLGHSTSQITEMYYVKKDTTRLTGITDGFEI